MHSEWPRDWPAATRRLAQLAEELAERGMALNRLDASFRATSQEAAEALAAWLRVHGPANAVVSIRHKPASTEEELRDALLAAAEHDPVLAEELRDGTPIEVAIEYREQPTWTVLIEGPARFLSAAAVVEWMALLQRVPSGEWAVTGFGIDDP